MDKQEFWTTKSRGKQYRTVTFDHPAFDAPFRLIADVFAEVVLGGDTYTPAPMTIKPPDQVGGDQPKMAITFPRQFVGRIFKQQLALIVAAGSREPITITYSMWLGETDAPKVSWVMYASDTSGITFTGAAVQVGGAIDNPARRSAALLYLPETFTGLQAV